MTDFAGGVAVLLTLFWVPTALILLSLIGLAWFKTFFTLFVGIASKRRGSALWQRVQPSLASLSNSMEASFGSPGKFTPSPTHVLLVVVALAVIIAGERARAPARRSSRV